MNCHASMNRIYRLIWSLVHNSLIAVAETARGRGKGSRRKLAVAALALTAGLAQAAPGDAQLTAGTGSISQSGTTTTIVQTSQYLGLDWQTFNIAAQETVQFVQPSAGALAVNRIFDPNGTAILGHLNANGQVWLLNPNGILFGAGAEINVGGLVASTLDLNDAGLSGNTRSFSGNGTGSIVNHGAVNAADGGYVALLGNTVSNHGTISARLGTVALGAGSAATLTFNDNSLVSMQVDRGVLNALANNGGLISAGGGSVLMHAGAQNELLASVVNNTGIIEAHTVENHGGVITLLGGMTAGMVNVGGTLDASAPEGDNGGFIETSAAQVKIANDARITTAAVHGKAGTWLIDPVDFTIAATGGDITGATLATSLGAGNVVIQSTNGGAGTAGDVNVNDVVAWSANKLTLNAQRNININANLNGTGTASLALEYGFGTLTADYVIAPNVQVNLPAGLNFSTQLNPGGVIKNYTVITSLGLEGSTTAADLQGMGGSLAGNYALGSNIDVAATSSWNSSAGFTPVGNVATKFTGAFDGLGHTLSNLTINRPVTDYVGLFGYTSGSTIRNVGLVGGSVIGREYVGGLVGLNWGTVSSSYASGNTSSGHKNVGGLAGSTLGPMSNVWATGNVSNVSGGIGFVGGLVGNSGTGGTITNAYATGTVSGTGPDVGGLVGFNSNSTISNAYATGSVSGTTIVGGLVGYGFGEVSNSYATGSVTGTGTYVGGLVGYNDARHTINNAYATGSVSGTGTNVGGLVGRNLGTVSDSYWNTQSSGQSAGIGTGTTTGTTGRSSAEMMAMTSFPSFDIANTSGSTAVWRIYEGSTTPWLRWFLTPLTVTATSGSKVYNGSAAGIGVNYSLTPNMNRVLGTMTTTGASANVGSYTITPGGLHSTQLGYDIAYANGTLTINKAPLTVTADDKMRLYGAANPTLTTSVSGFVNGENSSTAAGFAGTGGATTTANASTSAGTALINADTGSLAATNYSFTANNGTLTINKIPLTVTALDATRQYGEANPVFSTTVSGFVNGENIGTAAGFAGTGSATTAANASTNAGTAQISAGIGSLVATNYSFTSVVDGVLTITKAPLTVTANGATRLYGQPNPLLSTIVSGFVNGETPATAVGFAGAGSATTTADASTPVGTAVITAGGGSLTATNYEVTTLVDNTMTINKALLTLTTAAATRLYGQPNPVLGTTLTGFVNGETAATAEGFSGTANATTTADAATGVGTVPIIANTDSLNARNYEFTSINSLLTINKAQLTVTADASERLFGQPNPLLTTTVSGFVNGETAATAAGFTGTGTATTTADTTTPVGTAAITATAGDLAASNYDFSILVDGVLTIKTARPPVPAETATAQVVTNLTGFRISDSHQTLLLSPTIGGEANTFLQDEVVVDNKETRINIGGLGPTLLIVDGGVNVLDNVITQEERDRP